MASNAFKAAAASMRETKNLDTVLVGGNYLDEGTHDVVVQSVDSTQMDENKLTVTFADDKGKIFTDRMFLMNRDGTEFSLSTRQLWSATIPNKDALARFMDLAATDDHVFEMLTGMKLRITLKRGPGFTVQATSAGDFAAYTVDDKGNIEKDPIAGTAAETIAESRESAEAAGLKRSYLRIRGTQATDGETNVKAFLAAADAKAKGVTGSSFSAKVV